MVTRPKDDGTTFAHTHPHGSAAMPAVMLADESSLAAAGGSAMSSMEPMNGPTNIAATIKFPWLSIAWTLSHLHPDEARRHGGDGYF